MGTKKVWGLETITMSGAADTHVQYGEKPSPEGSMLQKLQIIFTYESRKVEEKNPWLEKLKDCITVPCMRSPWPVCPHILNSARSHTSPTVSVSIYLTGPPEPFFRFRHLAHFSANTESHDVAFAHLEQCSQVNHLPANQSHFLKPRSS